MLIATIYATIIVSALLVFKGVQVSAKLSTRQAIAGLAVVLLTFALLLFTQTWNWIMNDVVILLIAILASRLFGVNSKSALVSFCVAVSVADFISFTLGPTHRIILAFQQGESALLQYLNITLPLAGKMVSVVGVGDLLILGAIFYSFRRMGYEGVGSFLFPLAGLLVALTVGLLAGGIFALPFVSAGALLNIAVASRTASRPERLGVPLRCNG